MIELNLAQVIGYSVQVLLILALLVALSVRSWPFLIAIVFMGLIALALACMRAANNKPPLADVSTRPAPEMTSGHRILNDEHGDYGSTVPDPPLDVDSLDHVRPVSLALEGKARIQSSNFNSRSQPTPTFRSLTPSGRSMAQPSSEAVNTSHPSRAGLDRRRAPLMAAAHTPQVARNPYSYHQANEFAGSELYARHLAKTRRRTVSSDRPAHYPGSEAGKAYSPEKHGLFNDYARPSTGYVRQYTSPHTQAALGTTPWDLEAHHRETRWLHQTAQPMHDLPFASRHLMAQFGVNDWQKPDPNLVPVNPQSRSRVPTIMKQKKSPWATKSYLYRK